MVKIYTKTGDKGTTSLFGGKRVLKSDLKVELYGTVDELNSIIGVAVARIQNSTLRQSSGQEFKIQNYNSKFKNELEKVQRDLFEIGSIQANLSSKRLCLIEGETLTKRIKEFEKLIDDLSAELPQLKNFILPGGGEIGSLLHFARSIARRCERRVVQLSRKEKVPQEIVIYLNRLSDLLFVMARFINYKEGHKETIWFKNG